MSKLRLVLFASALALATAASSTSATAAKHQCICGDVIAFVQCSNGIVYTSPCFALCDGATNCKPFDWKK